MTDKKTEKPNQPDEQIRQLEKENRRLKRTLKRYDTQLQLLDKMASANEKININLYNDLDILSKQVGEEWAGARP